MTLASDPMRIMVRYSTSVINGPAFRQAIEEISGELES